MQMAELRTKLILRNDSTANWSVNNSVVLLKGEVGIEFLADGKTKVKIGDGVKTWAELDYFGGEVLVGDNSTIVVDGQTISLVGFNDAEVGAQLVKGADGKLAWIVPSTETVDGLKTTVATLQNDVTKINEVLFPSAEGSQTLLSRVETLETEVAGVDQKITDSINAFAEKISDDGTVNTLKELVDYVAEHGAETANLVADVKTLQDLVGEKSVAEQIGTASTSLLAEISKTEEKLKAISEGKKYEITDVPVGTLVDYRDKEIRVMCPADATFTKQAVGIGGDTNTYYMTFKTYAPNDNVVGYIEHLNGQADSEILTDLKTDVYGRRYQPTWLGLAKYDDVTGIWNYYGAKSSGNKFIGWNYQIDWYNADGKVIASDAIRINLSNEACHNNIEPFYMNNVVKGVKVNGTLLDLVNGEVEIEVPVIKSSADVNKIAVAEDGTMEVNSINVNKLVQTDGEYLILNGGSSSI